MSDDEVVASDVPLRYLFQLSLGVHLVESFFRPQACLASLKLKFEVNVNCKIDGFDKIVHDMVE